MIYFYARTSTKKQKIESQIEMAIELGIKPKNIYKEQITGTGAKREEWEKLKNKVKNGDIIVFQSIDRMSRNSVQGVKDYFYLLEKGVNVEFIMEKHLNSKLYFEKLKNVSLVNSDDELLNSTVLKGVSEYIKGLAKRQIILAFERAEEEAKRIKEKVLKGLASTNKKSGRKKGCVAINEKEIPVKKILKLSKKYNGNLNNTELSKFLGCSRPTLLKWFKKIEK